VNSSGKPFEVSVEASSGDKAFEKEAIRAAEGATYQPGMLNGQPIDSATKIKIIFKLNQLSTGASEAFVHNYGKLMKAVDTKDRAGAEAAMKGLEVRNLYEDAYFGLASYFYAREWGDETQQLAGLRRAIAFEKSAHYLTKAQFQFALGQCLALQVRLRHYAEAQGLWASLLISGIDPGTIEKIKPMMHTIDQIRTLDRSYDITGSMPDGTWTLHLYKQNFRFKVSEGHISYVKLRCSKGFVGFVFDPTLEYKVESKYGTCELGLDGDPGTQFTLTQF
jgi:TonB family protein